MTRFRKPFVAVLSACLVFGAACSSGSKSGSSAPKSAADIARTFKLASSKTQEASTMRFTMNMDIPGAGMMTGTGSSDVKAGLMAMSLTMPPFAPGQPALKMEQVLSGTTMYMKADLFAGGLPPGKSWMKLDLASFGDQLGIDFAALLDQSKNADPRSQLGVLAGVGSDAKEVGRSEIRGVETTHYKVEIDLKKALEALPDEAGNLQPLIEAFGDSKMPADIWLDDDGLARRITYTMSAPDGTGQTQSVTVSMDMFDFGKPVDIKEPTAAETVDFAEALAGLAALQ